MKRMTLKQQSGVSLVEVLMALGILGFSATLAAPSATSFIKRASMRTGVDALTTSLMLTRSEAVRRNSRVVLCRSSDGRSCSHLGGWEQGWIVFHDVNDNGVVEPGEDIVQVEGPLPRSLRVTGNQPVGQYVAYNGLGRTTQTSGAFQAGTITVCYADSKPSNAFQLVINSVGRVRVANATVAHCV